MPKLKTLSSGDVVKIFSLFGFEIEAQRGSHVKLRRLLPGGARQTLTIPMHDEMNAQSDLPAGAAIPDGRPTSAPFLQ